MRRRLRKLAEVYACFLIVAIFAIGILQLASYGKCTHTMHSLVASAIGVLNRLQASKHVRVAIKMLRRDDLNKAERHLLRALELDRRSFTAYLHLIMLRLARKDVKGADELLEQAKAHLPREQASHLYTSAGDWCAFFAPMDAKFMERYYREAIKLHPKNATAFNNYGYALAERGIKLDEAEKLIKEALKLEPNNPAFIDSMGWVYFKQGRYSDAAKWLERAVELEPNDAELRYHLGMAYAELGRIDEAISQLEEALRINPKHGGANQALEELKRQRKEQEEQEPKGEVAQLKLHPWKRTQIGDENA